MSSTSSLFPSNITYNNKIKFLTHDIMAKALDKQTVYSHALPTSGVYRHFGTEIKEFQRELNRLNAKHYTLSGAGSIIDLNKYGLRRTQPGPQYEGTSCRRNSLCLEPTCFGMVEGVRENNNIMETICWELALNCLKDYLMSDRNFEEKLLNYLELFFKQPEAVIQAYQRTTLLSDAIKVVATKDSLMYTGSMIPGSNPIPLPFYIDSNDPYNLPDLNDINALGTEIGAANLHAFFNTLGSRFFGGDGFSGGFENVIAYALNMDHEMAKLQTMSTGGMFTPEQMSMMSAMGGNYSLDTFFSKMYTFKHEPQMLTYDTTGGLLSPVTQDILQNSTIYGKVMAPNPMHLAHDTRAILFVPDNIKFNLVAPMPDDFSSLGLGNALDFHSNTPGVFPLSSSLFASNRTVSDKSIELGINKVAGKYVSTVQGIVKRSRPLQEAIRTYVRQTYSSLECSGSETEYPRVGAPVVPQGPADGFAAKSQVNISTNYTGYQKPVLYIFKIDHYLSRSPIVVCDPIEVDVSTTEGYSVVSCCPGDAIYATIRFSSNSVSTDFTVTDKAVYRPGLQAETFLVDITGVDNDVITIESTDGTTLLPCCTGTDGYGAMGVLQNITTATATSSPILRAQYDSVVPSLFLNLKNPIIPNTTGTAGTITLEDGTVINVLLVADASGVFAQVEAAVGEDCVLSTLDCECLVNAVFSY